jgi:hypothetical protein
MSMKTVDESFGSRLLAEAEALSDAELLARLEQLAAEWRRAHAARIAHVAELERRGLHVDEDLEP